MLAGVVILYNPDNSVINNITSYIYDLSQLIIVDNSDYRNDEIVLNLNIISNTSISYVYNGSNLGIAKALNIGADIALSLGYSWLLTMDQDSKARHQMVFRMKENLRKINSSRVGIISPRHLDIHSVEEQVETAITEVDSVMTSGNLLNLQIFCEVGKFDEKLFIDYVDHEYCLRLKQKGFSIIQLNTAELTHRQGGMQLHIFLGKTIAASHHNFIRRYYITRNRLYVMKNYKSSFPLFYRKELKAFWKDIAKIILFEKDKIRKMASIFRGYFHFKRGHFGIYK